MTEFITELRRLVEHLPEQLAHAAALLLVAALLFLAGYRLTGAAQGIARRIVARRHPEGGETLARAAGRIVWIAGLTLTILASLAVLGIDVGALLAAFGLSTVVLGFALKDAIEQAITGTLLLIQRPFHVGDVVQVEGVEGAVVDVAIRTTNIKTFDGIHALIPNNKVYQSVIRNKSHYPARRLSLIFGLGSRSDLPSAHGVLLGAVAQAAGVLSDPAPVVAFEGWEQEAIRTSVQVWIASTGDPAAVQTAVTQAIQNAAREAGLEVRSPLPAVIVRPPA